MSARVASFVKGEDKKADAENPGLPNTPKEGDGSLPVPVAPCEEDVCCAVSRALSM